MPSTKSILHDISKNGKEVFRAEDCNSREGLKKFKSTYLRILFDCEDQGWLELDKPHLNVTTGSGLCDSIKVLNGLTEEGKEKLAELMEE